MKELRGYFMILGAAALWGVSATVAKLLLNRQVDTLLIVQWRVTFSAILMGSFFLFAKRSVFRAGPGDLWKFALAGIVGVGGANFTYYFAIREGTVATAILIQYTAPLAIMLYGVFTGTEDISRVKVGTALLSLLGCFLAVGAYDTTLLRISPIGIASALGAMLTYAFLSIYTKQLLHRYGLWTTTVYSFLFASLFWLIVNPPWRIAAQHPSADLWLALLVLAVISVLVPHTLFFSGLRVVTPTRAVITGTFEPIVAIVSAALVLGELLEPLQVVGAVLVLTAIIVLQTVRGNAPDDTRPTPDLRVEPDAL